MEKNKVVTRLKELYVYRKKNEIKLVHASRINMNEIVDNMISLLYDTNIRINEIECLLDYNEIVMIRKELNVEELKLTE